MVSNSDPSDSASGRGNRKTKAGTIRNRPSHEAGPADRPENAPLPVLMTVKDVCALAKKTDRTIRNWMKAGHLRPIRIGRTIFFRRDEVEALFQKRG